jgi:hypothetical protein
MPYSYRGVILAVGLALASLGYAQEQTQPAEEQPAPEEAPAEQIPFPVPVEIIEDEAS